MTAEELRIGNLVKYNDIYHIVTRIDVDGSIRIKVLNEDEDNFEANRVTFKDRIQPISLTEDILLKCGFKKEDNFFIVGKRCLYFDKYDNVWYLNTSNILAYANNIDSVIYIHELQNIYYWSSKDDYISIREELEINLIINQTI